MMPPLLKQLWLVLGIVLMAIHNGAQLGLVGCIMQGTVPALDPISVSTRDSAWIASAHSISLIASIPLASYMLDRVGRRASLAATSLPALAASLLVSRAASVPGLLVGRLVAGIALNALFLGAIIIGECSAPKYRGVFLNLKNTAIILGSSIMHFFNYFLDWRTTSLLTTPLVLAALAIICTCPESPHWYILKNRFEDAEKSFFWIRGRSPESIEEFNSIISAQKPGTSDSNDRNQNGIKKGGVLKTLKRKDFLSPVFSIFLASIFIEACGRHTFISFAVKFISDIVGEHDKSSLYLAFIDLVTISSTLSSCFFIKHVPRRALMFLTGFTASILLCLTSVYLYLQSAEILPTILKSVWIPLSVLAAFFLLVNVGCIPICISMQGELFPLAHKALGLLITGVASTLVVMTSVTLVPYILDAIKARGTFALSALVMILTLIGLFFIMPETKDKTLQDIEDGYKSKKNARRIDGEELKDMISNADS